MKTTLVMRPTTEKCVVFRYSKLQYLNFKPSESTQGESQESSSAKAKSCLRKVKKIKKINVELKYQFRSILSVGVICDVDKSRHCQALDETWMSSKDSK